MVTRAADRPIQHFYLEYIVRFHNWKCPEISVGGVGKGHGKHKAEHKPIMRCWGIAPTGFMDKAPEAEIFRLLDVQILTLQAKTHHYLGCLQEWDLLNLSRWCRIPFL